MRGVATDVAEYELVIRARRAVTPEGVRPVTVAVRGGRIAALAGANAAYEQRFGHVFLICATGRGPAEILAELNRRMSHDPATEREAAAAEIGKINALRLRKLAIA